MLFFSLFPYFSPELDYSKKIRRVILSLSQMAIQLVFLFSSSGEESLILSKVKEPMTAVSNLCVLILDRTWL